MKRMMNETNQQTRQQTALKLYVNTVSVQYGWYGSTEYGSVILAPIHRPQTSINTRHYRRTTV